MFITAVFEYITVFTIRTIIIIITTIITFTATRLSAFFFLLLPVLALRMAQRAVRSHHEALDMVHSNVRRRCNVA